jgi:hypothetical protein
MEIKKIIASLNSEKLTVSSQEENVLRAHGKTLFFFKKKNILNINILKPSNYKKINK